MSDLYQKLLQRGSYLFSSGSIAEAEDIFRAMVIKFPDREEPKVWMTKISISNKSFDVALNYLKSMKDETRTTPWYISAFTDVLYMLGLDGEARQFRRLAILSPAQIVPNILSRNILPPNEIDLFLKNSLVPAKYKPISKKYLLAQSDIYTKIYNYDFEVISLGANCFPGNFASRWGIGAVCNDEYKKYPFDLGFGHLSAILALVISDFQYCSDIDNISTSIVDGKTYYCLNDKSYFFNHDFCIDYKNQKDAFYDELQKRILNFKNTVESKQVLFIVDTHDRQEKETELLLEVIKKYGNKDRSLFIETRYLNGGDVNLDMQHVIENQEYIYCLNRIHANDKSMWHEWPYILSEDGFKSEKLVAEAIADILARDFKKEESKKNIDYKESKRSLQKRNHQELASAQSVKNFVDEVKEQLNRSGCKAYHQIGSIVMNCNPFTLGHRHLIEYGLSQVDFLIVFVVEENLSYFKFLDRLSLVKKGTNDIKNICVVPSGNFIISSTTFPSYFQKDLIDSGKIDVSSDIEFFGQHIAQQLNIKKRFIGFEPTCAVTRLYNDEMKSILPQFGITVEEIPRLETEGTPISASIVRKLLKEQRFTEMEKYLPDSTYKFLISFNSNV